MIDRDKLIWAAGFFDGEGCVSISKNVYSPKGRNTTFTCYQLSLIVAQEVEAPIRILHEMFGGTSTLTSRKGVNYYQWKNTGIEALQTLNALLPYLVVKRQVAEHGIRFEELKEAWKKHTGRQRPNYPVSVKREQEVMYQKAKQLNSGNKAVVN